VASRPTSSASRSSRRPFDEGVGSRGRSLSLLSRAHRALEDAEERERDAEDRVRRLAHSARLLDAWLERGREPLQQAGLRETARRQDQLFEKELAPLLAERGTGIVPHAALGPQERRRATAIFETHIFPVLTPLTVGPAHPAPRLASLTSQVGLLVRHPRRSELDFARVPLPAFLEPLPSLGRHDGGERRVPLEQLVAAHAGRLFPGMAIASRGAFRVTCRQPEARGSGPQAVRLEHDAALAPAARDFLTRVLGLGPEAVVARQGLLDPGALLSIVDPAA